MLLPVLVLSGLFQLVRIIACEELSVIRHADGDIFTVKGTCNGACAELSSGTASTYSRGAAISTTTGISISNGTCLCQCNAALPLFREDLHICVSDIHECSVTGFVSNSGLIEKVPYVFLPQRGQIIYPQAEIRFEGVTTPVCGIAGSQQLGKSGWLELRNLSNAEPPFRLFRDEGRTFLQWIGEDGLRDAAEGKVVVAKLVCRDASPNSNNPGVFIPCVAFRVAGSPSKSNIREVTFASNVKRSEGLSIIEYTAIGVSSILLALIYVASVSLYLHSRKARKKSAEEPEVAITSGREGAGLVKNNPLLAASRHFESDTNSATSDDELGDELAQSDGEQGFENTSYCSQQVTSAIIHPRCMYVEHTEGHFGNGTILGERIPDEDVRIVETIENSYQHETPVLPGTQRRKLYFNPAYFERRLLLAPPPAAIEFLMKIREVISIAKHKMSAKRFVPTLTGIPEEETISERCSSMTNKRRSGSIQGSVIRSRKSQRCDGCPGCCAETTPKGPSDLPDNVGRSLIGDSRVRAWLEDVKPPPDERRRWHGNDGSGRHNFTENAKKISRSFEYLREIARMDYSRNESANTTSTRSLANWKDNPPMLRTFRNIARSEILDEDDRHSVSKRSTKSMFEESNYDRYNRQKKSSSFASLIDNENDPTCGDRENTINAKVRKAIENSFIKQMEEITTNDDQSKRIDIESNPKSSIKMTPETGSVAANGTDSKKSKNNRKTVIAPVEKLPDMIKQLPSSKIPAKRIMDAVIKEMVDVKALEHHPRSINNNNNKTDYEIDSLERTSRTGSREKLNRGDAVSNERGSSGTYDEVNRLNEIRDVAGMNDEDARLDEGLLRKNYYNNLPELLSTRPEDYSLVSEVYVNDGYASPAGSDDSQPEIRYEPENPGHLTITVQDSPENYVKHDDSEYEPDTLDRKPMRLRINGDVSYERETTSEIYVDSLERPGHIMLRSKGSFRDDGPGKSCAGSLKRGYGSLREIYEARLRRGQLKDSSLVLCNSTRSLNGDSDNASSWRKNKYLTPDTRQAKRQRKPSQNQPDVVPLPPAEEIYQKPKPPRRVVECTEPHKHDDDSNVSILSKNEFDRSKSEADDPTASDGTPVFKEFPIKPTVGKPKNEQSDDDNIETPSKFPMRRQSRDASPATRPTKSAKPWKSASSEKGDERHLAIDRSVRRDETVGTPEIRKKIDAILTRKKHERGENGNDEKASGKSSLTLGKIEDSGYLSSTDSNESRKQLLRHDAGGSVSETDETESMCDGASESGAESVGTDSVFFGNFRRLSDVSNFSKSVDSGVDFGMRSRFFKQPFGARNERQVRSSVQGNSDSEGESFVTVLSPEDENRRRNSLVL